MSDKVLVVQLGMTGMSFVRHFKGCGCEVEVVDERDEPPAAEVLAAEYPEVGLRKVASYSGLQQDIDNSDVVAVSPGVAPGRLPESDKIVGDLGCFVDTFKVRWPKEDKRPRLIAITGTNGKSTVASLVSDMLNAAGSSAEAVGNIGVPILDAMRRWEQGSWPRFIVAELSSFQLARKRRPLNADVACLLNVSADHLGWHGDEQSYLKAKGQVFEDATVGVYDGSDGSCKALAAAAEKTESFNSEESRWQVGDGRLFLADDPKVAICTERLLAAGIVPQSACAALTVASCATGWQDCEANLQWLGQARGLPHRLETVSSVAGVKYVNDSKATNEAAAVMALDAVKGQCVLLAGGVDKGQDFRRLAERTPGKVLAAVLIGAGCDNLERALCGAEVPALHAADMDEAVGMAANEATRLGAKTVLFSPACSSFDMYGDFAQRGDAFKKAVGNLREHTNA